MSALHFTYAELDRSQLMQGDIVKRTEEVERILEHVHPHYFRQADYRFFAVLTQSCDLVRRTGGKCSSRYITLSAARPARVAIERELRRQQFDSLEERFGFCSEARREKVSQFVEQLLNNNAPNYFFLRQQPDLGLPEDHCIFLQLSVALKSELHYEALLAAKILQLNESFQHKLGFLVGTSYSRVATRDWVPDLVDAERFQQEIRSRVDDLDVVWFEKAIHRRVLKDLRGLRAEEQTPEAFERIAGASTEQRKARREEALDLIGRTLGELEVPEPTIERARRRLDNNPTFRSVLK